MRNPENEALLWRLNDAWNEDGRQTWEEHHYPDVGLVPPADWPEAETIHGRAKASGIPVELEMWRVDTIKRGTVVRTALFREEKDARKAFEGGAG